MISQRPVIFGERETFDGLIAYTLDMENSFDIPRDPDKNEWKTASEIMEDYDIDMLNHSFVFGNRATATQMFPMPAWLVAAILDTLDTRPWWAVRLY